MLREKLKHLGKEIGNGGLLWLSLVGLRVCLDEENWPDALRSLNLTVQTFVHKCVQYDRSGFRMQVCIK